MILIRFTNLLHSLSDFILVTVAIYSKLPQTATQLLWNI